MDRDKGNVAEHGLECGTRVLQASKVSLNDVLGIARLACLPQMPEASACSRMKVKG